MHDQNSSDVQYQILTCIEPKIKDAISEKKTMFQDSQWMHQWG